MLTPNLISYPLGVACITTTLVSPVSAAVFGEPEPVLGAQDADDVAAVQDKAGRIHALAIHAIPGQLDELTYHYFDGESWAAPESVRIVRNLRSADLELDRHGRLHGSVLEGTDVMYLHAEPGSPWTIAPAVENSALMSQASGSSIDVTTNSDGSVVRHIAFTGSDPDTVLKYAFSPDGSDWTVETVDPTPGSGLAPSLSAGSWPIAGFSPQPSSPVIAYVDAASSEVRVSYRTRPVLGGDPFWTAPAAIALDGRATLGQGPKIEIRNGVAHLVCFGRRTAPEPERPLYFTRSLEFDPFAGLQPVETMEEVVASRETEQLEFVLGDGGAPSVMLLRDEVGDPWEVQVFERRGADDWHRETLLNAPMQELGQSKGGELLSGPLQRKTALFGRSDQFEMVAIREEGTATIGFPVENPSRVDPDVTPGVVTDGRAGGLVAFIDAFGEPVVRHYDPDGELIDELQPDDGRGMAQRGQVRLRRLESGRLVLAYVTSVSEGNFQFSRYIEVFLLDGTAVAHHFEIPATPFSLAPVPEIDLAVEGDRAWLVASQDSPLITAVETRLYVFDRTGARDDAAETDFLSASPILLEDPAIDVRDGHVVIVGANRTRLAASIFDPGDGAWFHGETVASFTSEAEIPASRDVVIRSTTVATTLVAVAFAEGRELKLAYRLPNTNWSTRAIGLVPDVGVAETQTAFVRLDSPGAPNRFHLAWMPLKGNEAGKARYARFIDPDNNPVDPATFLESTPLDFGMVESLSFAVDRYGLSYLAAFDGAATPSALRVLFPLWSRDDDGDGAPLFVERALCRDPQVFDRAPLLRRQATPVAATNSLSTLLSYDRPAGPATMPRESVLEAGSFRYSLEVDSDLRGFLPASDAGLLQSVDPLPSASDPDTGIVEQRTTISRSLGVLPDGFFRLDLTVRD